MTTKDDSLSIEADEIKREVDAVDALGPTALQEIGVQAKKFGESPGSAVQQVGEELRGLGGLGKERSDS